MPKRRSAKKKTSGDGVVVRTPTPTDVLFGRGGHVNHNPANQRYLELVNQRKEEYQNVAKTDKASIAWEIFHELSSKGARFLKKDYSTNLWHAVEDADVRRKISQCLRERGIPVCPVAKGKAHKKKQQQKAAVEMPKLRASARISSRTMTTTTSSKWSSSLSDEDEWLPEEEEVTFASRVTTRSSSYSRRREVSASLRTVVDDFAREEEEEEDEEEPARAQDDLVNTSPSPNSNEQGPVPNTIEQEEDSTDEAPPPMPVPVPLKQESSNRVWSDFFTRSFCSFAPSIFESNPENAWENLLDPAILPESILPELAATSEDEESFSSISMPCKRSLSQSSSAGRTLSISNPMTWSECITSLPPAPVSNKRRKVSEEPEDPDSFYDANAPSLGKVLEQSLGDFLTTTV